MRQTTISVTAESFEKVFVRSAINKIGLHPEYRSNEGKPNARKKHFPDLTDWRDIAWRAINNEELGDALRRAVLSLPVKYRNVLFLRDVKNLDTEEAAWILGIAARGREGLVVPSKDPGSRRASVCPLAEIRRQIL